MKIAKTVKNKKGFTLIELIVVLVILAIMAAIAIPSYMSFTKQARQSALLTDARVGHMAAQLIVTKYNLTSSTDLNNLPAGSGPIAVEFQTLVAECAAQGAGFSGITVDSTTGRVSTIKYTVSGVGSATYASGKWTTSD